MSYVVGLTIESSFDYLLTRMGTFVTGIDGYGYLLPFINIYIYLSFA